MDEIAALVAQKTGLSPEKSKEATVTVVNFIKQRLPDPLAAQIQQVLDNPNSGAASNVVEGLGKMFGGQSK